MAVRTVTQRELAVRLRLHPTTVSMALRGSRAIASETRRKVRDLARELGYQPNLLARNLRRRSSNVIGVIAPSVVWSDVMQSRLAATARLAHERGYDLMTYYRAPEEQAYERAVSSLMSQQVAAVIVTSMDEPALPDPLARCLDEGMPVVFMQYWGPDPTNVIDTDRTAGYQLAVEHLASLGHRDIAIVVPPASMSSLKANVQVRLVGFRVALSELGLAYRAESVLRYEASSDESAGAAMMRLAELNPRPTALVAYADVNACLCVRGLARQGLAVPRDVSVVGFNDDPIARMNLVSLTTLAQPVEELAELTVDKVVGMVEGRASPRFPPVLRPPRLIVRESTQRKVPSEL